MKDLVILAHFCGNFSQTDNGRFMYLCKELSKENKVEIITSDFDHSTKKKREPLTHNWPFNIVFLHECGYKKNISIRRFISHYVWGKEVKKYLSRRKKPDVVYAAIPSLTGPLFAAKYCNENNIRFVVDIQDIWPDAFQMVFHVPVISRVAFAPFKKMADEIYGRADAVCGVSKTYVEKGLSVNKKCKEGHAVFIGTKLETFDENAKNSKISIDKKTEDIWVGYCGSMSASYDLKCLIDSIHTIGSSLKLIAMGDGEMRAEFEEYARMKNVSAVFTGCLPYNQVCGLLSKCDIVVNPIVDLSAASIINKHADYAASGLPVLNTQNSEEYRDLVEEYQMGFNCENGNAKDVAEKLEVLIGDAGLRKQMGINARRCAKEKFDRSSTYKELEACILE